MSIEENYRPGDWQKAGDSGADRSKMQPEYRNGLLHLINYLLHTAAGREFMHGLIPGKNGHTPETIRPILMAKFGEFGVIGPAAEAMFGAHIAGFGWVDGFDAKDPAKKAQQETIYKQHIAAVSWFLWEESQGPIFSLGW